jgi:hypothetical protein
VLFLTSFSFFLCYNIFPETMSSLDALQEAVTAMTSGSNRFDVTIVCTTDDFQAEYWMKRLGDGICKDSRMILACAEDWGAGGAGNGLGTLYAYQKACKLAQEKYGVDLANMLAKKEVSAALFHTAGKGTRMAPLPASENNNKPGVVSEDRVVLQYALRSIFRPANCPEPFRNSLLFTARQAMVHRLP